MRADETNGAQHRDVAQIKVVQMVRGIGYGGGVSGVAQALDTEFKRAGLSVATITSASLKIDRIVGPLTARFPALAIFLDVLLYSVLCPFVYSIRYRDHVGVTHNDGILGDVFINHGLLRAAIRSSTGSRFSWLKKIKPLNLFILSRERIRFALGLNRVVVNFSDAGEREHRSNYKLRRRTAVIPNGVDTTLFFPSPEAGAAVRRELGIDDEALVAIFVGKEFKRKGLAIAIDAALEVNIDLIVVGGSPTMIERARANLRSEARIHFIGSTLDVRRYYNAADVLLLPSSQEAWPLVTNEAMACAVPVISTDSSSLVEIVTPGINGFLVERDSAAFAGILRRLFVDRQLLLRLKDGAFASKSELSWEIIGRKYVDLIRDVDYQKFGRVRGSKQL